MCERERAILTMVPAMSLRLLCALAILSASALAEEPPPPPPSPQPQPERAPAPDNLNFDLFEGDKKPAADPLAASKLAALEESVKSRRRMLTLHQAIGFSTLGLLAATLVLGQLAFDDKYGGNDTGRWLPYHTVASYTTVAAFLVTGLLAIRAPDPYPKPIKADPALLHKLSMLAATAGMVAQIILGPLAGELEGSLDQRHVAIAHLAIGYATFAFMAVGTLAYVF